MITLFEEILEDIGKDLSINLKPDNLNSCCLNIDDKLLAYLQINKEKNSLLIGIEVTTIPPGGFRENVFSYTLKANAQIPKIGTFGFNDKDSYLILFDFIPLENIKVKTIKKILAQLMDKGMIWKNAIEKGDYAPLEFIKELQLSP